MNGEAGAFLLQSRPDAEPALSDWISAAGTLSAYAASHPGAALLRGRGAVYVVPSPLPDGGEWVVRHYYRGGAVARALGDRYLRFGEPRPFRELELGRALARRGVATPSVVGAAVYPSGPFYRGDLVTERVADAVDLAAILFGADAYPATPDAPDPSGPPGGSTGPDAEGDAWPEPRSAMAAAGRLLRSLHDAGLEHPDLNLKNVLVRHRAGTPPEALVIDLDRGRLVERVTGRGRRRMLQRFWRSVVKWERRTGRVVEEPARSAFVRAYGQ